MGENWSKDEIEAAVEAYLQMLRLEKAGTPYNKAAISRALLAGPLKGRTSTDHRMQNISAVLKDLNRDWIPGFKPLENVGPAARAEIIRALDALEAPDAVPTPQLPPVQSKESRKLPSTGYWIFICRRERWDGEAWLKHGESETLYKVSEHNRDEVQVGDLGVLRLNKLAATKTRAERPAGVYALVEVIEPPKFRPDENAQGYSNPDDGRESAWRARIRVLANLIDMPVAAAALPESADFQYIREPLQTSSIPISRRAFATIVSSSGINRSDLTFARQATTSEGVLRLERMAKDLDPVSKEKVSRHIERGPMGQRVKEKRLHRCQLCEALGLQPVAFIKKDGAPYAEAHHVQPVSLMLAGSLAATNIMVLCPNHHRQAHYGSFKVVEHLPSEWLVELDGMEFTLPQTVLD